MLPSIRGDEVESRLLDEHSSWLVVQLMFLFSSKSVGRAARLHMCTQNAGFCAEDTTVTTFKGPRSQINIEYIYYYTNKYH